MANMIGYNDWAFIPKMTYQRRIEEGYKKMYESGTIQGKPIHINIGDKVFPLTEICETCPHKIKCVSDYEDKNASEAQ